MSSLDVINQMDSEHAWSKARRGAIVQKVLGALQDSSLDLIPFDEARKRLHLNQGICRGLQEIELEKIRGSVNRYNDFTSAFLPRHDNLEERWERVRSAWVNKGLPPIEVFKVGQAYFVSDGNHRVSIARQERLKTINAYVYEYLSPVELSGEADLDEVIRKAEYAEFLRKTELQPEQEIIFTVPGRYMEIECQIQSVQQSMENDHGKPVSFADAANEWYREIYAPTIQKIRDTDVLERFPGRTEADLFVWMWRREPELQIYCAPKFDFEEHTSTSTSLQGRLRKFVASVRKIFS